MSLLLAIETSTKNCSVALFDNGSLLQLKENNSEKYLHAEKLTVFIDDIIKKAKISFKEIKGVILSKGPGSYTGLRIGTSTAKGLCYSLDIPLISVSTLRAMAFGMSSKNNYKFLCPMIDARRMEVFSSIYDQKNNQVREIKADIVDSDTYLEFLKDKVVFFGDGALKCKQAINNPNAHFIKDVYPSANDLGLLGMKKFINKDFEDVAYFEPYYLKDFVIGAKEKS
ncbi:MAG: tRNA (adenosine(37)-N6)-threonylcarbamoyltransferase complex dimerization subunit type 1 TsaB [Flavobacteriales bacterium]|nr:tRNA (adenosine(37)-N6)-threonylcarbamoyltransferase complex dimerization subunit type 1 TsaB [Flavobacteriales bacterium]